MIALSFGIFGLIIGSFLNVVILRHDERSIGGRSACMKCSSTLRWFELIPVASWLALRGRCRSCRSRISVQYPLVEAATATMFVLIGGAFFREGLFISPALVANIIIFLAITSLLICIFVYDLYHMIIPDEWVFLFAALALVSSLFWHDQGTHALIIILAGPLAALPLYLMWLISGGKWMGFGDPKLALGMGWLLGPIFGLIAVFFAFIIGALISVGILIPLSMLQSGRSRITIKSEVPFGPFLIASTFTLWLVILYGLQAPLLFLFS